MDKTSIDSTNPLIFFGLIAIAFFFILLSMAAIFLLGFLLVLLFSEPIPLGYGQIFMLTIIVGMIGIGVWNIIDSAKLMDKMEPRLLGPVFVRSLIALLPLGALMTLSYLS
ncbi:MAG: hypothetical protein ABJL47_02780 [Parasphingorhabdus sp.]